MINQYHNLSLEDGYLYLSGSSFNIGGDYGTNKDVKRSVIIENVKTFKRYETEISYIDNGEYKITLVVPDNLDKTRAWFSNKVDVSSLEKGTYAIYIKTTTNVEDYGELNDIFSRKITTTMNHNDKNYSLKVDETERFRIELIIS